MNDTIAVRIYVVFSNYCQASDYDLCNRVPMSRSRFTLHGRVLLNSV